MGGFNHLMGKNRHEFYSRPGRGEKGTLPARISWPRQRSHVEYCRNITQMKTMSLFMTMPLHTLSTQMRHFLHDTCQKTHQTSSMSNALSPITMGNPFTQSMALY